MNCETSPIFPSPSRDEPFISNALSLSANSLYLNSSISSVNQLLEGGLRWGELSEWGVPWGCGGREVFIHFLSGTSKNPTKSQWSLWAQGQEGVNVYPPAWEAKGVDLKQIRFTKSLNPVRDLKPIFLNPFFKIIIMDCPQFLSADDCQFLSRQARKNNQIIIIIRNYFLSSKKGNIWAKVRLNCWQNRMDDHYHINVIKGLSPRQISFQIEGSVGL